MKLKLLWIGRAKHAACDELIQQYGKRLKHYCDYEIVELKDVKQTQLPPVQIKQKQAELILRHIGQQDFVVLLDERGKQRSSQQLADDLQQKMNQGLAQMVLVIGGAWGVDNAIRDRASFIWSLSQLTFTHDMARVLLVEQLYRAMTILRGEKYHNP